MRAPLAFLAALVVGAAVAGLFGGRVDDRPNVVLIVIDTLRADHLGSYGYDKPTSPHLDALAARGTRYANARAPSSWTGASVASILTGLYPAVHGLEKNTSVLSDDRDTMAETFRHAGYATVAFSANPAFVTPEVGLGQGFGHFQLLYGPPASQESDADVIWKDQTLKELVEVAPANEVTNAALRWLARHDASAPFLLYLHYFDPHAVYAPPESWATRFGAPADHALKGFQQRLLLLGGKPPPSHEDLATLVRLYDAEIAFTDAEIGRFLDGLAAAASRPTLVVVTSDHGEEFGEHGGMQHGRTLFEEQLRVPLILAGPGVRAGTVVESPVSLVELWSLVAATTPQLSALGPPVPRRSVTDPIYADLATAGCVHRQAMIDGAWKLLQRHDYSHALYHLDADPREQRNVSAEHASRVGDLRARLGARQRAAMLARAQAPPADVALSEGRRAKLRALGYVR